MINETLQWIVLIFLAVFAFGLTRQLGQFMVQTHQDRSETQGPDIGHRLPRGVLTEAERHLLAGLAVERDRDWIGLIAVDEQCRGCDEVLTMLEEEGIPGDAPVAAITRGAGVEFAARLERIFDVVGVGEDRVRAADLTITPFVLLLNADFKVAHKSAAASLGQALVDWRGIDAVRREPVPIEASIHAPEPLQGVES